MKKLIKGDTVTTYIYGSKYFFTITDIELNISGQRLYTLSGVGHRTYCTQVPEPEIIYVKSAELNEKDDNNIKNREISRFEKSIQRLNPFRPTLGVKILHLDSVEEYAEMSGEHYNAEGLHAEMRVMPESEMPEKVCSLLEEVKPDILVITGHDSLRKGNDIYSLKSYMNSRYFIEAVYEARRFVKDPDELIIFGGSCQSFYEKLINVGANFAASPDRVLINALDPAVVCRKIATTNNNKVISPDEVSEITTAGCSGISGIPTRGKYNRKAM